MSNRQIAGDEFLAGRWI